MKWHPGRIALVTTVILNLLVHVLMGQQSMIRTYTVGDGLVMNRVRGFHQDKEGFIWMYTWDGLSRYEGYRFRNYIAGRDLQHSFVNDIFERPDGTLYLPLNDGSMAVMHNQEVVKRGLLPGDVINDFFQDNEGRILVGTDHSGICVFEDERLIPLSTTAPVMSILQAVYFKDHYFFVGPFQGPSGVYDLNMNLVASWEGPPAFYSSIYKDYANRIYLCTMGGLKEVNTTSSRYELQDCSSVPDHAPWKNWNINSIIVTPSNEMWLGSNQGLIHLHEDKTWSVLTVQDGLLSNQISSLFLDKSNTLWIGTDAGAASINLSTRIVENRNLPGVYSNFLLPDQNGQAYVITGYAYLNQVDRNLNIIRTGNLKNESNSAQGLIPEKNNLLVVRQSTIEELDPNQYPFHQVDSFGPGMVYAKLRDQYLIATDYGFFCTTPGGPSQEVQDTNLYVSCVANTPDDQLLIGTLQDGLFLAGPGESGDHCEIQIIKDFSEWTDDPRIRCLMISKDGDVWIGTRFSGVLRLQCKDNYSNCKKQSYSISNGLISNWITSLAEDQYGNIWVGSASGIDKLIPNGDIYTVFSFSRVHGYYANVRHVVAHPDGSLWVGHGEGITRIMDGRIDTIGPPVTYLTEVSLGGSDYTTTYASSARLHYDQNSAHFAYAAPDFVNATQLMFTYRLLGSKDTAWSSPVKTHEIFYGNLRPGKFRFEVASFGWNGKRSVPVGYSFEIMNPFWKQAWFILLAILLISAAIFAFYRFRISQIQQLHVVRDRIAADLHDEIGSSLTHINILSEIGKHQHPDSKEVPALFERIGSEVQTSSEALDDIIWSVKTKRDAIGDIIARMRQYATEIFEPAGITFHLHEHVEGIQSLEMEFKRDFYLVYKELLRNVLRHAAATEVDIHITVDKSQVSIRVKDNGQGFDVHAPTQRNGMLNIQSRVKKWNGRASWNSSPASGTDVTIEMRPG